MLDLNNRNWASFKISDLFQPARGTEKKHDLPSSRRRSAYFRSKLR